MSGGKSACISRGSLSVLYFHSSFIPFTFETFRMCSFFCHAVRCGSPPSVSQSAIATVHFGEARSRGRRQRWRCAKGTSERQVVFPSCSVFTFYFLLFTFDFLLLRQRKHPDRSAFGHFGIFAREHAVEARLHRARVDAETRLHGHVLPAVDGK